MPLNPSNGVLVKEAAHALNVTQSHLYGLLRKQKIFTGTFANIDYLNKGYFFNEQRTYPLPSGAPHTYWVSLVTPKGMSFIQELLHANAMDTTPKPSPKQPRLSSERMPREGEVRLHAVGAKQRIDRIRTQLKQQLANC